MNKHFNELLKVALVIPFYNESERFSVEYFANLLCGTSDTQRRLNVSLVLVDDGSTDDTYQQMLFFKDNPNVHIQKLKDNVGKSNAVRLGLLLAKELDIDFIGYLDSDGAFREKDVLESLLIFGQKYLQTETDMLSLARVSLAGSNIERKKYRHFVGRVVSTILSIRSNIVFYDSQSGFKVFSKEFLQQIDLGSTFKTRWFLDWEIILRSSRIVNIVELPVQNWKDVSGSKISPVNFISIIKELILIKVMQLK